MINKKKLSVLAKTRKLGPLIVLILGMIIMVTPFLWAISGSLARDGRAIYNKEFFNPPFYWTNYTVLFKEYDFVRYICNSFLIAAINIIGTVLSNSFIGFGLAKYEGKVSNAFFMITLCTLFLPATTMLIPMYIIWNTLGLVNTFIPLTAASFFGWGFNVFLMRQAFKGVPPQLYEAAVIDGARPPRIFWQVYLSLVKPMLASLAVLTFIGSWNNLFGPLIYITDQNLYTVPIALTFLASKYKGSEHLIMAASLIAISPTIIIYAFAQKYFVSGITSSAVKG